MRILILCHAFNSLTQRLYLDLMQHGHEVSIEFDIADSVSEEAVDLFRPELIVATYLRRAIPRSIWSKRVCMVVHPGIVGDRGPSALDWVLQEGQESRWGVTVLQAEAEAEMDAGPVWASEEFPLRAATKGSLYRNEVTEAASRALLAAIDRYAAGQRPIPLADAPGRGRLRPLLPQAERRIDWRHDGSAAVLAKIRAADGFPGVADSLWGEACHLYDAWPQTDLPDQFLGAAPGQVVARRETALLRRTVDGAVWIGQVKRDAAASAVKLPAALAFGAELPPLPTLPLDGWWAQAGTWQDIAYLEAGEVGVLSFEFYNGAMGTEQCRRLGEALRWAQQRPTRVLLLTGGEDFWSNGIHLNLIESAESPADESWRNIEAMDDLAEALIANDRQLTVAALQGNAGAGGVFLARAADLVWARQGVLLNPHYKNMGNLYGSEYWTYLLPPRVGVDGAAAIMQQRRPMDAAEALRCGLIDACLAVPRADFAAEALRRAQQLAAQWPQRSAAKRERRAADEATKPLAQYRAEELAHMRRNFYGFDPSYHVARYHFVHKTPVAWTPRHLARHRDLDWTLPQ